MADTSLNISDSTFVPFVFVPASLSNKVLGLRLHPPSCCYLDTMASAGLQLLGFFVSLLGLAAIVASTFMVEWKSRSQGSDYHVYTGLWMKCSGHDRTTCEVHHSILELPSKKPIHRLLNSKHCCNMLL